MITSRSNPLIKLIRSLERKSVRDEENLFVAEGVKSVAEAVSSGFGVKAFVGTEKGFSLLAAHGVVTAETVGADVQTVTDDVFKSISGEVSPQGVLALVKKPVNAVVPSVGSCLFLDGVQNPANVGAIIRTAAAAGYVGAYLADCADAFGGKAVRASMGGVFRIPLVSGDRETLISVIDKPFIVADMNGENVFARKKRGDFCLVIGNEGNGLSEKTVANCNETVMIPMPGRAESLNAASAAAILIYSATVQTGI